MVKPWNISKVFHRNAQVLAWLKGESASRIDWQDTHRVWTATNSQRHQTIQYWHNLNEIWEHDRRDDVQRIMTGIFHARKKVIQFWSFCYFWGTIPWMPNCVSLWKISLMCSAAWRPCLSIFPNRDLKYVTNRLVSLNNRPNPRLLNLLHKYRMLASKTNPRSSL